MFEHGLVPDARKHTASGEREGELHGSLAAAARVARLGLTNKGTGGAFVCARTIGRPLAALKQGERPTAGSDEGTSSPKAIEKSKTSNPHRLTNHFP